MILIEDDEVLTVRYDEDNAQQSRGLKAPLVMLQRELYLHARLSW